MPENELTADEEAFLFEILRAAVGARVPHLRLFRQIVADVAAQLRDARKKLGRSAFNEQDELDGGIATELLVAETRLLMALSHAEKGGIRDPEGKEPKGK